MPARSSSAADLTVGFIAQEWDMRHGTFGALALAALCSVLAPLAVVMFSIARASAADTGADSMFGGRADGGRADEVTVKKGKMKRIYGIRAVAPGMNQTELQSVLGPPDYIQVNGTRQAWQYCPHFLERIRIRRGDFIQSIEHLFARRDGDYFITVWFNGGQVEHLRAYPEEAMGNCADFYAAFRWEDIIDGEYIGVGGEGIISGFDK
jgi:hypothetical protein